MGNFPGTTIPSVLVEVAEATLPPDRSPFRVYLARLAPGSRPAMADALATIARIASGGRVEADPFPWHELRYQHTQAIRQRLVETVSERTGKPLSPASVNKALAALRGVLREAWRLGLMSAEDLARATDLEPVRGSRPLRGRALEPHEVAALFHACMRDTSPAGPRDAVVLALGLAAGLRRAEIAGLDLADVDLGREVVRVHGKGNKVREVPVKGGTLEAIRAWLERRGTEPGPLVCPVGKGGRVDLRRLAPQAILRVCEKRGREAGLTGFAAHDLRRSYLDTAGPGRRSIARLGPCRAYFPHDDEALRPAGGEGTPQRSGRTRGAVCAVPRVTDPFPTPRRTRDDLDRRRRDAPESVACDDASTERVHARRRRPATPC